MSISLRMTEKESELIKQFADLYGVSVSEFIRKAVFERIEDEYDIKCAEKAIEEFNNDPVTYSLEEVAEHLGLKQD